MYAILELRSGQKKKLSSNEGGGGEGKVQKLEKTTALHSATHLFLKIETLKHGHICAEGLKTTIGENGGVGRTKSQKWNGINDRKGGTRSYSAQGKNRQQPSQV